jgi:hypothetical protein
MNPKFVDPNNHAPAVAPDDAWGDVEGCLTGPIVVEEIVEQVPVTLPAAVLPPKRPKETSGQGAAGDEGLRIDSNLQRRLPDEPEARLEVQAIDGSVVRLDPEVPAAPRMPRQLTFHEKPQEDPGAQEFQGEGREWGKASRFSIRWIAAISFTVAGVVIAALVMLPKINQANAARPNDVELVVETDDDAGEIAAIEDMLARQPEAIQMFRKFATSGLADDVLPLLRDRQNVEPLVRGKAWAPIAPQHWKPSSGLNWFVFEANGQAFGILDGSLPDFTPFSAYIALKEGQLYLDWKATTGYSTAGFEEMSHGMGNPTEVRVFASPSGFYTDVFPESDFQSWQLFSPDGEQAIWAYTPRESAVDADLGRILSKGAILDETQGKKKVTLKLARPPGEALPNQWLVEEMLHKDWITP